MPDDQDSGKADVSEIIRRYDRSLRKYLRERSGDSHDIEDIVQESYLRLMTSKKITELRYPGGYLFRIAANLLFDRRKQKNLTSSATELDVDTDAIESTDPSPEENKNYQELKQAYEEALNELPLKCQHVFHLRRQEGLKIPEIAEKMGISTRMVHKYMARAIEHLHKTLLK